MEIVRDDDTSILSNRASIYPKKNPEAWSRLAANTTCIPELRIAEELWAIALPQRTATVPTAMGGIKGEISLTRPWKYWFRNAPPNTGRSTTWFKLDNVNYNDKLTTNFRNSNLFSRLEKLTWSVESSSPIASTATYCPASLAVRKGVIICTRKGKRRVSLLLWLWVT